MFKVRGIFFALARFKRVMANILSNRVQFTLFADEALVKTTLADFIFWIDGHLIDFSSAD